MTKMTIVIADEDEGYLSPLEIKFVEEMTDAAEIITITDREYFEKYFSTPRKIDILIINEEFYSDSLIKHNIDNTFILKENEDVHSENNEIYKYTSVKDIYDEIIGKIKLTEGLPQEKKQTETIMIYSPAGGTGTSTLSLIIAETIAKRHKRVLYLSTENIQSLSVYLGSEHFMSKELERKIALKAFDAVSELKNELVEAGGVYYVPPIRQAAAVLGIREEHYIHLIQKIRESNDFDYIVVDTDSGLTSEKVSMMVCADRVAVVAAQDRISAKKLDIFLDNIDCSDTGKFMFICNKYRGEKENNLTNSTMKNSCIVKQYVEFYDDVDIDAAAESDSVQNFVYGLL